MKLTNQTVLNLGVNKKKKRQNLAKLLTQSHSGKWKLTHRRKFYVNVLHEKFHFGVQ